MRASLVFLWRCRAVFGLGALLSLAFPTFAAEDPPRLAPGTAAAHFPLKDATQPVVSTPAVQPGTYADLLDRVTPAVVSVFSSRLLKEIEEDDPLGQFFNRKKEETTTTKDRERLQGSGSGVIISADGWIVTNSHVVHLASGKLADAISIELSDRRRMPARVAGVDPATDLALLKIDATGLPFLPLADSDAVRTGDLVFAIGNPFRVGMTSTMGMVSAKNRTIGINGAGGYEDFIQTDAAINPGNSGGALVDATGRLIGINSAIYGGSGGNVGIGFAISSTFARQVLVRLAEEGKVVRGFFGLQYLEVDADIASAAKLDRIHGVKIAAAMDGGPGAKAGLRAGDIVLKAAGTVVENRAALRNIFSLIKPGIETALDVSRAGERLTLKLTPITDPEAAKDGGTFELASLPGVKFRAGKIALIVASLTADAARKTQLEAGMEILEINGAVTTTATQVEAALRPGINKVKARAADGERTLAVRVE